MSLDRVAGILRRWIPDPFVIAILLTFGAIAFGVLRGESLRVLIDGWVAGAPSVPGGKALGGLWALLSFAMQMCLILVTGYVVANTPIAQRALERMARIPNSTPAAAVLISLVAMGLALLNWGLGLIAGALLAREVGIAMQRRGIKVHYPILAAAGYTGLCVWHGGLSGSAPLKVTDLAGLTAILGADLAAQVGDLPLTRTVLSPRNILTTGAVLLVVPALLWLMVPKDTAQFVPAPRSVPARPLNTETGKGFASYLDNSPWLTVALAALCLSWMVPWLLNGGLMRPNPDSINVLFLTIGLLLAGGPVQYMRLAERAAGACAGIIVQFPLYGGILGLLAAGGVVRLMSDWMPESVGLLSLSTFLSAGVFNLFVPSGGGQWAVQGPIVMSAAVAADIDPGRIVLSLCWGDQWTNLFQPFWALPLLGITGARAGDIFGYTAILGVVVGIIFALGSVLG